MPTPRRRLVRADLETFVRERCFAPAQRGLVGLELERHPVASDPAVGPVDHRALHRATAAISALPGGSHITFEPGGQLEVSSPPRSGPSDAATLLAGDLAVVDSVVAELGIDLAAVGLHPGTHLDLVVDGPRYRAMAAYLDASGPCGRTMMCSTAAVQVNLDIGDESTQAERWRLAHHLGPVLLAAFANSSVGGGAANGWRSGRAAAWEGIDASRTAPATDGSADPAGVWLRYALAARVMLIRVSDERFEPILSPLSFARWLDQGHELGFPTLDDFAYHLGTLFPPVRARGWLELRMIDALPAPWWTVAAAVCAALLDDAEAASDAARATLGTGSLWAEASRHGLAHPVLATAARSCFAAALDALPRLGADPATIASVDDYCQRFVARGRCPADDSLDRWRSLPRPLEASWT